MTKPKQDEYLDDADLVRASAKTSKDDVSKVVDATTVVGADFVEGFDGEYNRDFDDKDLIDLYNSGMAIADLLQVASYEKLLSLGVIKKSSTTIMGADDPISRGDTSGVFMGNPHKVGGKYSGNRMTPLSLRQSLQAEHPFGLSNTPNNLNTPQMQPNPMLANSMKCMPGYKPIVNQQPTQGFSFGLSPFAGAQSGPRPVAGGAGSGAREE